MRKCGLVLFVVALILIPGLARAGGVVPMQEPGAVSLLGAGLLGLACICGVLTVKGIIADRRSRFTSIDKP